MTEVLFFSKLGMYLTDKYWFRGHFPWFQVISMCFYVWTRSGSKIDFHVLVFKGLIFDLAHTKMNIAFELVFFCLGKNELDLSACPVLLFCPAKFKIEIDETTCSFSPGKNEHGLGKMNMYGSFTTRNSITFPRRMYFGNEQ